MEDKIIDLLKRYDSGLSITELVKLSHLSRGAVRISLAKLEGGNKVSIRRVGMAKLYYIQK